MTRDGLICYNSCMTSFLLRVAKRIKGLLITIKMHLKYRLIDIPTAWINKRKYLRLKKRVDVFKKDEKLPAHERGDYHANKIRRGTLRILSFIFNWPKIIKNRKCRILVVVHLFYMKSADEIIEYLKNLKFYKYDLVVTYIDGYYKQEALDKIRRFLPDVKLKKYNNNGFDIGPFIDVIDNVDLDKYDIVIKMQSKSTNKIVYIYDRFFKGRDWFRDLWNGVLGSFSVHATIDKLFNNTEYGVVAAKSLIIHDPKHKQELTKKALSGYKINYVNNYYFVAGSCFAIRSNCLKKIQQSKLELSSFGITTRGFFSLAHAVERAICFVAMPEYKFFGNKVDFWRNLKWRKIEKGLKNLSGLNKIKKVGSKFIIPPDYIWFGVEHSFLEDVKIDNMKIGDIKRRRPQDDKVIKLKDSEPYLFLKDPKKNRSKYEKYCDYHIKNNLPNMSVERFENLIKSIKKEGFNKKSPIIVDDKNIICDGQHRACILMYLNGEDYEIPVVRIKPVLIDFLNIKPFTGKIPLIKEDK